MHGVLEHRVAMLPMPPAWQNCTCTHRRGCVRAGTVVAVKVRHPGVTLLMQRDVVLMHRAAALSARLPGLAALRLDESVRQFGAPLREQVCDSKTLNH